MRRLMILGAIVLVSLINGLGQTPKKVTYQTEPCTDFIVERQVTRWTDTGLITELQGHSVKRKGCVEPRASKIKAKTQRF